MRESPGARELNLRRVANRLLGYRCHQVLEYVRREVGENGQPPSYAMIREELDIYDNCGVHRIVRRLERRGLVYRDGTGSQRRIRLITDN